MTLDQTKEKKIFRRLIKKEQEAFAEFYDLYVEKIYRFIYFKIGSREEAEDLTASVFLKTWNCVQSSDAKDYKTLKSLVYRIARNLIIDQYRKNSIREDVPITAEFDLADDGADAGRLVDQEFTRNTIEKKLLELKDEYRDVVVFRFIEDFSVSEIAQILGKSKGNIRVILHRAIKALRDLMEEEK